MQLYIDYAAEIYGIYLKYISKDDIHVYSIDEAFMDVTDYLSMYRLSARELGARILNEIYEQLRIHATCGIEADRFFRPRHICNDQIGRHGIQSALRAFHRSIKRF